MPRPPLLPIAAALLLATAAPAAAKGVVAATVCGPSECREVARPDLLQFMAEGGQPVAPPATPAAWYRATLTVGGERVRDRFSVVVVPARRVIRGAEGDWMPISAEAAAAYRNVMAGADAFPADTLPGFTRSGAAPSSGGGDGPPAWPLAAAAVGVMGLTLLAMRRRRAAPGRPMPGGSA